MPCKLPIPFVMKTLTKNRLYDDARFMGKTRTRSLSSNNIKKLKRFQRGIIQFKENLNLIKVELWV